MQIYKVGGAVRDRLLNLPVLDNDWVVIGSSPKEMISQGYLPVGKDFPVFLHPDTHEEYALARTERKSGQGYKGFTFYTHPDITLVDDLKRRDFTINAMAEDASGQIIDPYGGQQDLAAGILRHVSPAFVEDPLRVLRAARFAARFNFNIADETLNLLSEISATGELKTLVAERVWGELESAMQSPYPARFVEILHMVGALAELFPEIEQLFGVPQPAHHHPEIDTGTHTLMVLTQAANLSEDPQIRLSALLHDLGKGNTPKDILPHHYGHEERGGKLVENLCRRYKIPKSYRELAVLTARYHLHCHRIYEMTAETIIKALEGMDAFRRPERFLQFLQVCEADARGRTGFENRAYPQADYFKKLHRLAGSVQYADISKDLSGTQIAQALQKNRIAIIQAEIDSA